MKRAEEKCGHSPQLSSCEKQALRFINKVAEAIGIYLSSSFFSSIFLPSTTHASKTSSPRSHSYMIREFYSGFVTIKSIFI